MLPLCAARARLVSAAESSRWQLHSPQTACCSQGALHHGRNVWPQMLMRFMLVQTNDTLGAMPSLDLASSRGASVDDMPARSTGVHMHACTCVCVCACVWGAPTSKSGLKAAE